MTITKCSDRIRLVCKHNAYMPNIFLHLIIGVTFLKIYFTHLYKGLSPNCRTRGKVKTPVIKTQPLIVRDYYLLLLVTSVISKQNYNQGRKWY